MNSDSPATVAATCSMAPSTVPARGVALGGLLFNRGSIRRPDRENGPPIMYQVLQAVGGHIHRRGIHRVFVTACEFGPLRIENVVDFILDLRQLGLLVRLPDSARQGIERIQRGL